jgi:hypothetical protein
MVVQIVISREAVDHQSPAREGGRNSNVLTGNWYSPCRIGISRDNSVTAPRWCGPVMVQMTPPAVVYQKPGKKAANQEAVFRDCHAVKRPGCVTPDGSGKDWARWLQWKEGR